MYVIYNTMFVKLLFFVVFSSSFYKVRSTTESSPSRVTVDEQGAYQGLVVSINVRLHEDAEQAYLQKVEDMLSRMSESVHEVLGLRFGTVTLLIPSHFNAIEYSDRVKRSYGKSPEKADILIQPLNRDTYTQHIQGCGKQALYMAVNSDFVLKMENEALGGRTLLHEWLHARYGVFDEHPILSYGDVSTVDEQKFYGSNEVVRCSLELKAMTECKSSDKDDVNGDTKLPNDQCEISYTNPLHPTASIMTTAGLENVNKLCNRQTHNVEAQNRHNRLCDRQSVMDVIEQHKDFNTSCNKVFPYSPPEFEIHQLPKSRTVVFILDSSKSMEGHRLFLAKQAAENAVEHILEDNVKVMIIKFDQEGKKVFPANVDYPVELDSKERRLEAIEEIRNIEIGPHTCIGCGLNTAYELLDNADGESVAGTFFVLLSDGEDILQENKLTTDQALERSLREGFFIDSILFTEGADDRLVEFAAESGSSVFAATDNPSALVDAFTEIIRNRQDLSTQVVQIYSEEERVPARQNLSGIFEVEGHLVSQAEVTFYWDTSAQPFLFLSISRVNDGKIIQQPLDSSNYSDGYVTIHLGVDDLYTDVPTVFFKYFILNKHPSVLLTTVVAVNTRSTEPSTPEVNVMSEQSYGMKGFVAIGNNLTITQDIRQLETPIIYAYLPPGSTPSLPTAVIATVTITSLEIRNLTSTVNLELRDTGVGADILATDGVYSAYFTQFVNYAATYYVRIRAKGDGFMRYTTTGYFTVFYDSDLSLSHLLPPSAVKDVQMSKVEQKYVTLTFTAPGGDLDTGKANHYIFWFANGSVLLPAEESKPTRGSIPVTAPITPNEAYKREVVEVKIPLEFSQQNEFTVWVSLTAVDEQGSESNISNSVYIHYERCPPGTIIYCLQNLYFFLIQGAVGVVLLLTLIGTCVYYRRRSTASSTDTERIGLS